MLHPVRVAARQALHRALEEANAVKAVKRLRKGTPLDDVGNTKSVWEVTWGTPEAQAQLRSQQPPPPCAQPQAQASH